MTRIERLDPSLDEVPVEAFNVLVDVVNDLHAAVANAYARNVIFEDKDPRDAIDAEADG